MGTKEKIIEKQKELHTLLLQKPHNIVFLDIDGVLNTWDSKERTPFDYIGINQHKVSLLKQICEENHAMIVLSSSWKDGWKLEDAGDADNQYLIQSLADQELYIADSTTECEKDWGSYYRGKGILAWLASHPHKGFIILDDERFDFGRCGLYLFWIQTSYVPNGGLKEKHVAHAKQLFKKQEAGTLVYSLEDEKAKTEMPKNTNHFGKKL